MNRQQQEISNLELTTEELDAVSGGMRNNETQAWKAFMKGFDKGWTESGGSILILD
jgi:bacteriocin-like protein